MIQEQLQLENILTGYINAALLDIHTATVARVTAISEDKKTINCQVVINKNVNGESIPMPEFIEVPPVFMQGGGSYTAHPVAVGDYCLLIITERAFDNWYSGRDDVLPPEFRTHDYSDAFAIVGVNPLAAAISIPEVITHIGDAFMQGNYEHEGDMTQTGKFTLTGDFAHEGDTTHTGNTNQTGDHTVSGTVDAGTVNAGSFSTGGTAGVNGTVVIPQGGPTLTFENGIITNIA